MQKGVHKVLVRFTTGDAHITPCGIILESKSVVFLFAEVLKVLFEEINSESEEEALRDAAIKFLTNKVKQVPEEVMVKDVEEFLIQETKEVGPSRESLHNGVIFLACIGWLPETKRVPLSCAVDYKSTDHVQTRKFLSDLGRERSKGPGLSECLKHKFLSGGHKRKNLPSSAKPGFVINVSTTPAQFFSPPSSPEEETAAALACLISRLCGLLQTLSDVTGPEFVAFMRMLSTMPTMTTMQGRKELVDIVEKQAELDAPFDVSGFGGEVGRGADPF